MIYSSYSNLIFLIKQKINHINISCYFTMGYIQGKIKKRKEFIK